ncbi:MAG TPA: SIMPL domain-containing protein [Allosphingosinicella sp.]
MGIAVFLAGALALQPPAGWQDGAASLLMGGSGGSTAASPVQTQPLAANEVLLEVNASGIETSRADLATITFRLSGHGSTEAAARADHDAAVRRVREAAGAAGVATADIEVNPASGASAAYATLRDALNVETRPAGDGTAPQEEMSSSVEIRLRDMARLDELTRALEAAGAQAIGRPSFTVRDDSAARRAARTSALARARADAEAYAASLNMRVARIVRVTERGGMDFMGLVMGAMSGGSQLQIFERMERPGPEVPSLVMIGVDFALAPR